MTTKRCNDGFDLERTEILGDTFLKFAISLFLFEEFPFYHEGKLTILKSELVSNKNLFCCAEEKNIPDMMKDQMFDPKVNFIVPGYIVDPQVKKLIIESKVWMPMYHF